MVLGLDRAETSVLPLSRPSPVNCRNAHLPQSVSSGWGLSLCQASASDDEVIGRSAKDGAKAILGQCPITCGSSSRQGHCYTRPLCDRLICAAAVVD